MKKSLTKLIASCAAIAAVSTAMAVSASAATYEEGKVTPGITSAAADGAQATILVYKADSAETEATADTILYIDQAAKTADLWKELSLTLEDGKYVIKMGGEGAAVASEVLSIGVPDVTVGDVNADTFIDVEDATMVISYFLEKSDLTADQLVAADTNLDNAQDVEDATNIISYFLEKIDSLPVAK